MSQTRRATSILSGGLPIATADPSGANLLFFSELVNGTTPAVTQFQPATVAAVLEPATLTLSTLGPAVTWYQRRRRLDA